MNVMLSPYLNFMGKTKEAMEFYHSVFGGKLSMQTFKEAGIPHDPKDNDNVIHARLENDSMLLMASDGDAKHPVHFGNNIHMSLMGTDEKTLRKYFDKLSSGGKVDMPLAKQFWGDIYGQLTDKFGVHWMVNITSPQQK